MKGLGKRCVLVSAHYPPISGGLSDYTEILAGELTKRGYKVTVVTRDSTGATSTNTIALEPILDSPSKLRRFMSSASPAFVNIQYTPFMYSRYGTNFRFMATIASIRNCARKIVTTFHETFVELNPLKPKSLILTAAQWIPCQFLAAISDYNIVSVEYFKTLLPFAARHKTYVIPVGSNICTNTIPVPARRIDDYFRIATFGAFMHPYRRFDMITNAIGMLPPRIKSRTKFIVFGEVGDDGTLHRLIEENSIEEITEFTGRLSRSDLLHKLSACDLFILLEYTKGGRNGIGFRNGSLMAALSAAVVPLINAGLHTDKDLRQLCYITPAHDPSSIANKIASIFDNKYDLTAKRERIHAFYKQLLHWDKITDRLLNVIGET